jgi:UDP-N-acetylglucosamine 2-epimerase (non-hydrolysing)
MSTSSSNSSSSSAEAAAGTVCVRECDGLAERVAASRARGCRVAVCVFGTRPEVIKMFPVVEALRRRADAVETVVCVTGQHRQMIDGLLTALGVAVDVDLNLMLPAQTLDTLTARVFLALGPVLDRLRPDMVLVQGDTTTAAMAALCAFYRRIPVGHVEAGLRTRNIYSPFPEEVNRRIVGVVGGLHFAPTNVARDALLLEGTDPASVHITGNPVIDAVQLMGARAPSAAAQALLDSMHACTVPAGHSRVIHVLLTAHRRESHGAGIASICRAVKAIVAARPDVHVWYPVHLNPAVHGPVHESLGGLSNVHLLKPLEYDEFVHVLREVELVLTDSGGIQEEVTALAKPTLVLRDTTERPEGVTAGVCKLVGTDEGLIVSEALQLLTFGDEYTHMSRRVFPFGDGTAGEKIAELVIDYFSR